MSELISVENERQLVGNLAKDAHAVDAVQLILSTANFEHSQKPQTNSRAGSQLFNAYSMACHELGSSPQSALIEQPIELDENQRLSQLGIHLINLLNSSLSRQNGTGHSFSPKVKGQPSDVCESSETNFTSSLTRVGADSLVKPGSSFKLNQLFIDEDGTPVLFRKGFRVRSALSLIPVDVHGVVHPAGTIFSASRQKNKDQDQREGYELSETTRVYLSDDIKAIRPLRLSSYAIGVEERDRAMRPKYRIEDEKNAKVLSYEEARDSLPKLTADIPDHQVLGEIAMELAQQ
ncbi:MAG TPA: hypothetical protein VK534_02155 [Methylomirabilota bacterium]|nr:hypothetical protein [Methylomirabilota bacterium]